jgi:hypoxanthine phosphoribosyltransferase
MLVPNELKVFKGMVVIKLTISDMCHQILRMTSDVDNIVLIIILKGGVYVGMKLLDLLPNTPYGFIGLSSYGDKTESSKKIVYNSMLDLSPDYLKGKDVWIVDDVCQEGHTLTMAVKILATVGAKSIRTATLVRKTEFGNFEPDVVGIRYRDKKFLVGCGMGRGEHYRSLPYIAELLKE